MQLKKNDCFDFLINSRRSNFGYIDLKKAMETNTPTDSTPYEMIVVTKYLTTYDAVTVTQSNEIEHF